MSSKLWILRSPPTPTKNDHHSASLQCLVVARERPTTFAVTKLDGSSEQLNVREGGIGHRHQPDEVARRVRAGLSRGSVMPLGETLQVVSTMDAIRNRIGLSYRGAEVTH